MIIDLSKSKLFTDDPDARFAKEYGVPLGTWKDLWRRHQWLEYTNKDLRDYFFMKYARYMAQESMERWIVKSHVYMIARPILDKGATHVNTSIFNDHEQYIINEFVKNIGSGNESRSII